MIEREKICRNFEIPEEAIELPTRGGFAEEPEFVKDSTGRTGDFYRFTGIIRPIDPKAPDIRFTLGIPVKNNKKLLQCGGAACDGFLAPVEFYNVGRGQTSPSPMKTGYCVLGNDSGHQIDLADPWRLTWALNEESLRNFAYEAQKKCRDAAVWIYSQIFGCPPERVYFGGGSNGGREGMQMAQKFAESYDGVVCLFPVLYWVQKLLADERNANLLAALGEEAWISPETYREVQKTVLDICGDLPHSLAKAKEPEVLDALSKILCEKQLQVLKSFASPMELPFPLAYGKVIFPGYPVFQGAALSDTYSNKYGENAASRSCADASDGVVRGMILQELDADPQAFVPKEHEADLLRVSKLLDVYGPELDDFFNAGKKLLLVQGTADVDVSCEGTDLFYQKLKEKYGNSLLENLRYFVIPGYAHGNGERMHLDTDLVEILDCWVENGIVPDTLIAVDYNDQHCVTISAEP